MCRRFARNFTDDEREKEEGYLSRRIESSIRLHFLEQEGERVFFWNALRLFYLVRFGEYLEVQEMQGES